MKTLIIENKTQKIASYLRKKIKAGKYKSGDKLPSTATMAKTFGVTKETVNVAVSHLVSEDMVYRKQGSGTYVLDYKSKKTKMLGVLLPGKSAGEFFSTILKAIDDVSSSNGYQQLVKFSGRSMERENECLKELINSKVDGIILYFNHPEYSRHNIDFLLSKKIPFILIDRRFPEQQCDYIGFDNFAAGYMATNYCIKRGHKNIAFISTSSIDYSSVITRLDGYRSALKDNDFNCMDYVLKCNDESKLKTKIESLLDMKNRPTAILTNHLDEVVDAMTKKNLKIPNDISVIKFGHISDPFKFFTHVDTPTAEMAKKATEILLDKIMTETYSDTYMIELKPHLVAGASAINIR
jgi:DNA-binding LacI/PurR family transcriptional regulator